MLDDALGGKGVKSSVEDPAASCKEGTSRLLDVFFNRLILVHDRLGDHNAPKQLAEVVRGNCKSPV